MFGSKYWTKFNWKQVILIITIQENLLTEFLRVGGQVCWIKLTFKENIVLQFDYPCSMVSRREKIAQPDWGDSSGDPLATYAFCACSAKWSSTQRIASAREMGISARKSSITFRVTTILQSFPPNDSGTVKACLGVVPETFGLSGWYRMRWLFQ